MEEIRDKHKPLIDGLSRIYECLAELTLIQKCDILYPPHNNPGIDLPRLTALGYNNETIVLIQNLPFLANELVYPDMTAEGIFVAPESKALSFLGDSIRTRMCDPWTDPRRGKFGGREGSNDEKLDPWMLRLTEGGNVGTDYIYNSNDGTITEWSREGKRPNEFPPDHFQFVWRPTAVVLAGWLYNLRSLFWIPLSIVTKSSRGPAISALPYLLTHPLETMDHLRDTYGERQVEIFKNEVNLYVITKQLYLDHGWPDHFDRNAFDYSVAIFSKQYRDASRPPARFRRGESEESRARRQREHETCHDDLLRHWGGNKAL